MGERNFTFFPRDPNLTLGIESVYLQERSLHRVRDVEPRDVNHARQRCLREKLDDRMQLGAALGLLAGACCNIALGGSGWEALFTTSLCGASGGIVGLLLWLASSELPEDPIPPVRTRAAGSRNTGTPGTRVSKETLT